MQVATTNESDMSMTRWNVLINDFEFLTVSKVLLKLNLHIKQD